MIHETSTLAIAVFLAFVAVTLGLSFYLGKKAKSSAGYFAAHGQIPWFVNGVAFAGDYLSAASFLGICGMIAFYGYDGFLYSIGYLAGWVVALFVVAEPMKRLGKFTFADALNTRFNSPRHQAGRRREHAGREHVLSDSADGRRRRAGAAAVGPAALGGRGDGRRGGDLHRRDRRHGVDHLGAVHQGLAAGGVQHGADGADSRTAAFDATARAASRSANDRQAGRTGKMLVNGLPHGDGPGEGQLRPVGARQPLAGRRRRRPARSARWSSSARSSRARSCCTRRKTTQDRRRLDDDDLLRRSRRPAARSCGRASSPTFTGIRSDKLFDKLNFISLMLALFCGTASLPHILIRYYTVKDEAAARKSTIVGIACIGFFYVLTLYMGLGAMTSGALDVTDSNMAAPLLGPQLQRAVVRDHLGDRVHDGAGHGERADPGVGRRGDARPAGKLRRGAPDRSRAGAASPRSRRSSSASSRSCWASCSRS